jgi:hypothetical protein
MGRGVTRLADLTTGSIWSLARQGPKYSASADLEPSTRTLLARQALAALLLVGVVCLAGTTRSIVQLLAVPNNGKPLAAIPDTGVASQFLGSPTPFARSQEGERDFVSELPSVAPSDQQIRYAARITHEQAVSIVQMQTESLKADSKGLGRSRITLQLRGDYRDVKNVWIALLAKYPGLVMERLNLRHHADGPPGDRADDEATVEMIQYTQPAGLAR